MIHTIGHVSDLHLGRDRRTDAAAGALAAALHEARVDAVLVTGDLTHRGRRSELRAFEDAFAPLLDEGRVVIVPGNHDRAGEDAGATLMVGSRVGVADLPGVHVVLPLPPGLRTHQLRILGYFGVGAAGFRSRVPALELDLPAAAVGFDAG